MSPPPLKDELQKKLEFFGVSKQVQDEVMLFVNTKGILADPAISINESRDKKDNFLLELSEASQADYLVTRDDDLLTIKKRKGTKIMMPEHFLPMLRKLELIE